MKFFIFKYSMAIISCLYLAYFFYSPDHTGNMIKTGTSIVLALLIFLSMYSQIKSRK
ncbi:hypothetical protein [Flavobacterium bizetiae]|uniref:hypothetical protein n=1 Tax=Flavobacterium bizetiae TaxID=2704140 RepID=UPI00156D4FEE|nr:hypothetical protein [Flavobacterium bizetiae]UTN04838.1 hypothetical protein L0669_02820 [Flavobacterium bizetiae]CAD5341689.1 hypothetical protein FLA105535_01663 [Flavobacterium bizetiae]